MNLSIVELHKFKEYMSDTADVLNDEWPRSKSARLHRLEKSCDELPCSLVLLKDLGRKKEVIGHSSLLPVLDKKHACFVESVVVRRDLRGKGYGRELMNRTEDWAKKHGYTSFYLTTIDKQDFYSHLGYTLSDKPIVSMAFNTTRISDNLARLFCGTDKMDMEGKQDTGMKEKVEPCSEDLAPVPPQAARCEIKEDKSPQQAPPAPPPPPAPPAPPAPPLNQPTEKGANNNNRLVERLKPNATTWMEKILPL